MRIIPPSGRAGNYHLTIDVYYNEAGAALTVPNGPFSNLRNFVKKSGEREFEKMIRNCPGWATAGFGEKILSTEETGSDSSIG